MVEISLHSFLVLWHTINLVIAKEIEPLRQTDIPQKKFTPAVTYNNVGSNIR